MKILSTTSLLAVMLLTSGCGGGDSSSAVTVATTNLNTITAERGRVLNATVKDAAGQSGQSASNGEYVFTNAPTYPITVTGGVIDVNNNGVIDAGEPFLTIPMTTYEGTRVTLVTTLIADADKTVRDAKLNALQAALQQATGNTIDANDLLLLPTENTQAAVLSNELFEAVLDNEIASINDINITEMTALLNNAQFVRDFDTSLESIANDINLTNATPKELAISLEEKKIADLVGVVDAPSQEELNILSTPFALTEAMVSGKKFNLMFTEGSTQVGTSYSKSFYSENDETWYLQDGALYSMSGSLKIRITTASEPVTNTPFIIEVTDSNGNVSNDYGTLSVYNAENRVPLAIEQNLTVMPNNTIGLLLVNDITLSGSDADGDSLTYATTSIPAHGTITGIAPNIVYSPNYQYAGNDSFTFKVNDGTHDSVGATVNITVSFVNTPPVASVQDVSVEQNSLNKIITLAGTDINGDNLTYAIVSSPTNGTLSGTTPNLTYTPNSNYNGSDSFTFKANDGTDDSLVSTVSITVNPGFVFSTVTSPYTQRVWMDRNLGSSKVCVTYADRDCYGDYYQWGRDADGHEKYNSTITSDKATTIENVGSSYVYSRFLGDWTTEDTDSSLRSAKWSKTDGSTVCPVGFRIPTRAELQAELVGLTGFNESTFEGSYLPSLNDNFLKLPAAGSREVGQYRYQDDSLSMYVSDERGMVYVDGNMNNEFFPDGDYPSERAENIRCIQD